MSGLTWIGEDAGAVDAADGGAVLPAQVTLSDVRPTRRGRLALFYQDAAGQEQFLFSVDGETAARLHLAAGAALDSWELRNAQAASDLRRAKDKALQLLAVRDHASGELYQKLTAKHDEHTAAAAVAEMHRLGLLDDAAFAVRRAAWLAQKGKSRRAIDQALAALGIDRDMRGAALAALPDDEDERLAGLVRKSYAAKLAAGKRDSVAAALIRRGFSGAAVRRVLAQVTDQEEPD